MRTRGLRRAMASIGVLAATFAVVRAQTDTTADYSHAVALYKAGETREAIAMLARLDRKHIQAGAADLEHRRSLAGRPTLLAAGLMHLDLAVGDRGDTLPPDFEFQTNLTVRLFSAADNVYSAHRETAGRAHRTALRAIALILLDGVSGLRARAYAEGALFIYGDDPVLLTVAGSACETEGTGRWDPYSPEGRRSVRAREHKFLIDARRYLKAAVKASPDPSEPLVHLAHIDVLEHDDRAADDRLSALLAHDPPPAWKYMALLQQSEIRLRAGDTRRALATTESALQLFPMAQSGLVTLSALLYQANDRAGAARVADRVVAGGSSEADDPWWDYRFGHWKAAERWLAPLRAEARE